MFAAPLPWPLPEPPATPMMSECSGQPRTLSFDSVSGRSDASILESGTPMSAGHQLAHRHHQPPVSMSVVNNNMYVTQQPSSSSSSWQAQNAQQCQFVHNVRSVAAATVEQARHEAHQAVSVAQQHTQQVYNEANEIINHTRTEAQRQVEATLAAAAAEVTQTRQSASQVVDTTLSAASLAVDDARASSAAEVSRVREFAEQKFAEQTQEVQAAAAFNVAAVEAQAMTAIGQTKAEAAQQISAQQMQLAASNSEVSQLQSMVLNIQQQLAKLNNESVQQRQTIAGQRELIVNLQATPAAMPGPSDVVTSSAPMSAGGPAPRKSSPSVQTRRPEYVSPNVSFGTSPHVDAYSLNGAEDCGTVPVAPATMRSPPPPFPDSPSVVPFIHDLSSTCEQHDRSRMLHLMIDPSYMKV
jgi:hypothetical protein